jgi:hypothetical protein
MIDPIITLYGKGQLSCFLADPDAVLDLVSNHSHNVENRFLII